MKAICGKGKDWVVSSDCDVCGVILQRRYRNEPGVGSYREMGLFCHEHGLMVTEHVLKRQTKTGWLR